MAGNGKEKEEWRAFADEMRNKRSGGKAEKNKTGLGSHILVDNEMIVQRLASVATGKAMKYDRLGPQEFVPYPFKDLTIENIKDACYSFFRERLLDSESKRCDILATPSGPSCSKLNHIKSFKVIYIRFVNQEVGQPMPKTTSIASALIAQNPKRKENSAPTKETPVAAASTIAYRPNYAQSVSLSTMLKVGSTVPFDQETPKKVSVQLSSFTLLNEKEVQWSHSKEKKVFYMEREHFADGGFRKVFKAKSSNGEDFVFKRFKQEVMDTLVLVNARIEGVETKVSLAKRAVQMHTLAKNFTLQLKKLVDENCKSDFGETFSYNDAYFGLIGAEENEDVVMIERYIPGDFQKYLNNDGTKTVSNAIKSELIEKAECLSHFSFEKSKQNMLLVDIQGSGFKLYDPEIATNANALKDGKLKFCLGNLGTSAVENFFKTHECNKFCKMVGLEKIALENLVKAKE